jgi:hypothetical protein
MHQYAHLLASSQKYSSYFMLNKPQIHVVVPFLMLCCIFFIAMDGENLKPGQALVAATA